MLKTICSAFFILSLCSVALAQHESAIVTQASAPPLITAGSSSERVRFAAPGAVVQMRLQVYAASGQMVFDATSKGNVLDWTLQDGSGERVPTGSYLCVVTVKSLNGKLGQRIGEIGIDPQRAELRAVDPMRLTSAQQREIGPVEEDASIRVLEENEGEAATIVAHNGEEGQIARGGGALSFRIGDFFSGKDREQMRLTAEGNLGIGITNPQARLEVDGLIRASQGIVFPDGTTQYSAASKTLGAKSTMPGQESDQILGGKHKFHTEASGTGTQSRIAKWTDNAGTLGDSGITENVGGDIGIGTPAPGGVFDLQRNNAGDILQRFWNTGSGGAKLRYVAATGAISQLQLTDLQEWLMAIAGNNQIGMQFRVRDTTDPNTEPALAAAARMTILRNGNVGINTTAPGAKLEVVGDLRSSALRQELTASSPNVIAGFIGTGSGGATPGNRVSTGVFGATIGGGGFNDVNSQPNRVTDSFGTVGGGRGNVAGNDDPTLNNALDATVGGGDRNTASGQKSTVGGGVLNTAGGTSATIGGGDTNATAGASFATVGGGQGNTASGFKATVGGGGSNTASEQDATVGGGIANTASGVNATVGGGVANTASGTNSVVPGGNKAIASHWGEMAFSSDRITVNGDAQTSVYTLSGVTVAATTTELFLDLSGHERITLATERALSFDILVVAKAGNGQSAGYTIRGIIKNVGGTVSFVGTPTVTVLGEDVASWNVTVEADDTNDALVVKATGAGIATVIHWVAAVRTAEVEF